MPTMALHFLVAMLAAGGPAFAVEWGDAPGAVREVVTTTHPDAEIREVKKARHRAKPAYQIEIREAEGRVRLEVAADGTIREERAEVRPEDLPESVAAALDEGFPAPLAIESVEKVVTTRGRRSRTTYEVEMTADGQLYRVVASAAGSIINVD
ncbi:hypothetical protein [Paludisphaera sp.]|uniref:hypothetical protein n=1 Tax=Paludisphaera sp. TaxID=2017432 RepID=UPI00301CFD8C